MRKIFLMLGVSLFSLEANAQECVDAPDCTELGYTQTEADCPNGAVKCPWNTGLVFCGCGEDYQYSCDDANEIAGNSKCGDYYTSCNCASGYEWKEGRCVSSRPKCNIGNIFYSDNTCTSAANYNSSKTVLGIVVYVTDDGRHGQIMAPKRISLNSVKWGNTPALFALYPGAPNYTNQNDAEQDYDSCGNTDFYMNLKDTTTLQPTAVETARNYAPTPETTGKWCLPAAGIFVNIANNKAAILPAVNKLGDSNVFTYAWSSTIYVTFDSNGYYQKEYAWYYNTLEKLSLGLSQNSYYIYPVLEF